METCNRFPDYLLFQFTRPTRAAIRSGRGKGGTILFQFTRPHGPRFFAVLPKTVIISIHATLQAAMRLSLQSQRSHVDFNSRDPYGPRLLGSVPHLLLSVISIHATPTGRDLSESIAYLSGFISIHATPTGRDCSATASSNSVTNFNSRDPYGPRLPTTCMPGASTKFQFTRPIRAAMQSAGHWITTSIFQFTRPIRAAISWAWP